MTRRQMAGALLAPAAMPVPAAAQTASEDLNALAQRNLERNRETLAKFKIEMSLEPAFRFEA
ncbi:MAG: hypothetical protein R2762_18035 [Bryobacteraceae bacterium]